VKYNIRPLHRPTCAACMKEATHEIVGPDGSTRASRCYDHCIEWIEQMEESERIYADAVHLTIEFGRR
jgi:hypothetical protein